MSFYENKKKAALLVDEMLLDKRSLLEIELAISTKYGFGRKFIQRRIELIEEVKTEQNVFPQESERENTEWRVWRNPGNS